MQLAARLTLLNAFINNGSVFNQYLHMENELRWVGMCTREANHSILFRHSSNFLCIWGWLPVVPGIFILFGDSGEFCIHLSGFSIILLDRLPPMSPETILIQRIDVNRKANRMGSSYTCNAC